MSTHAQHESAAEPAAEPKSAKKGLLGLACAALFIFGVVVVECLAAYFLVPSASDLAAAAEAKLAAESKKAEPAPEKDHHEPSEEPETVEVDLGTFHVSTHLPASNTTLRIDFKLAGAVAETELKPFDELFSKHENRIRERVILEIRGAALNDLSDPGLGLIKRRILTKVNAVLGKPVLRSVIVSDFSLVGA